MDKTRSKQFDKLMERQQEQVWRGKYEEALKTLGEAAKLLEKEKDDSPEAWAWIYDSRRYALYELGAFDEALAVCRKAIEHLGRATLFPYLQEHSHVRATLRAAHNTLAWKLAETAQNEAECLVALEHINNCFSTVSPIDNDNLDQFQDTHAMVFLRLSELAKDADAYKAPLHMVLLKMVKKKHSALDDNEKLKAVLDTPDFQAYRAEDPEQKLLIAPDRETADEALLRYKRAIAFILSINETLGAWFEASLGSPLTEEQVQRREKQIGISLPPALRRFALEHGSFSAGDEGAISIIRDWDKEKDISAGLVDYIDYVWGGRPEFEEFYKDKHLEHLNGSYFAFGMRYIDDNCHEYLFFDKQGNFGSIFMDQDDFASFQDNLNPMLTQSTASMSFDELISQQITCVIEKVLEDMNDA